MDKLLKKLQEIKELAKALDIPPSPKPPKPPTAEGANPIKKPEAPKAGKASSKKDPTKVAEQLQDPSAKNQAMDESKKLSEGVKFSKSGQWSLYKFEDIV